jgi:hypothetical protein
MLGSFLAYSYTPKMEVTETSEMSVDFQQITKVYISKETTLRSNCCEEFTSVIIFIIFTIFLSQGCSCINCQITCSSKWVKSHDIAQRIFGDMCTTFMAASRSQSFGMWSCAVQCISLSNYTMPQPTRE